MFIITPIFSFLLTEALFASGISSLYICALIQSIYTQHNLTYNGKQVIEMSVSFFVYTARQIAYIIIGILAPHFF